MHAVSSAMINDSGTVHHWATQLVQVNIVKILMIIASVYPDLLSFIVPSLAASAE